MTLPVYPNPISLAQIATEWSQANNLNISFNSYHSNGTIIPANTIGYPANVSTIIPSSGQISFDNFHGATSYTPSLHTYTTPGSYNFTVPTGMTSINVLVVGSGSGGGNTTPSGTNSWGGGGGGQAIQNTSWTVTPGETLTIVVAAGGIPNHSGSNSTITRSSTGGSINSLGGVIGTNTTGGASGSGNSGGTGITTGAGGGGGQGSTGSSVASGSTGGTGGSGSSYTVGSNVYTVGGGGGGGGLFGGGGSGGTGGGGAGGSSSTGSDGTNGLGGGGGGASRVSTDPASVIPGGHGGSGGIYFYG